MANTILPDTSLCAIVRDEMINPAQLPGKSGIRSFVESHIPYVEQAVIVDTGSIDGTRQELEQLASEFPNLKVYDKPFRDYASARNHSLRKVQTKRALVLDVDELIIKEDFKELGRTMVLPSSFVYFRFKVIDENGYPNVGIGHSIRLAEIKNTKFFNQGDNSSEYLYARSSTKSPYQRVSVSPNPYLPNPLVEITEAHIIHFAPGKSEIRNSTVLKQLNWYDYPGKFSQPPSLRDGFKNWKHPNPHRSKYK